MVSGELLSQAGELTQQLGSCGVTGCNTACGWGRSKVGNGGGGNCAHLFIPAQESSCSGEKRRALLKLTQATWYFIIALSTKQCDNMNLNI